LTPHWVSGLQLSFDWYSINIKSAIFTPTAAQVVAQCAAGQAEYCADMLYGVPGFPMQYPGALNLVILNPQNAASETTSGLDFQADYAMELFSGSLNWHAIANYNDERTKTAAGVKYDGAGSVGGDNPFAQRPKFNGSLAATYTQGPWSGTVQGRFLGSAVLNNAWRSGIDVDNNAVPWVAYLDLRGSYNWNDNVQLYAAIDNTTDTPPPSIPNTTGRSDRNLVIYDGIGRQYRFGFRFNF
jgi:outer membrane receptor protein involved in Fe transport